MEAISRPNLGKKNNNNLLSPSLTGHSASYSTSPDRMCLTAAGQTLTSIISIL